MAKKKNTLSGLNQFRSDTVKLTIYPEFESLIPPLSDEESKNLEEVLLEEGIKDSILYWKPNEINAPAPEYIGKNIIIDGHNRYKCALKNKLTFKTKEKSFNTIEEVQMWMAKNQLSRRNVTDADRTYLIGLIYNREKEDKGKYTREAKGQSLPLSKINNNEETDKSLEKKNRTDEKIATETGTSPRSVRNAGDFAKGMEKLETSFKKEVLSGKEKIPKAKIQKLSKVKGLEKNSLKTKEDIDKVLDKKDPKKPKVENANLKPIDEHIVTIEKYQSNNKIAIGEKYTLAQASDFSNEIINFIKQKKAGEELTLKAIDMVLKYFYDTKQ